MNEIQTIALNKALKFLNGSGCQYAIVTDDGETISNGLEVVKQKERTRAPRKYPYGEVSSYYRPLINFEAEVGSVQLVPCGKYEPVFLQGCLTSTLSRKWGTETYITNVTDAGVEVLRIA